MNILCDVCTNDSNTTKGAYLLDGDTTNSLTFLCPHCYELSHSFSKLNTDAHADAYEFIADIEERRKGKDVMDLFERLIKKWKSDVEVVKALIRVYLGYKAGLENHPLYEDSLDTLIIALVYGIGFPVKPDFMFFPLNMNISTTANNLLFRRSMKKLVKVKISREGIESEVLSTKVCETCLKEEANFICYACKSAYYCSANCLINGAVDHVGPCKEIQDVDKEVKSYM